MKIILASQSPFRKRALDILGLEYDVNPSNFDEKSIRNENYHELARELSEAKARKVGESYTEAIIIAADLFVIKDDKIYEKPVNEEEAFSMLRSLSGNCFDIVTGLAVYNTRTKKMLSTTKICEVTFRSLLEHEIEDYIARYPVLKCAAAFEIDGFLRFSEHIKGDYVVGTGMSINDLILFLREQGVNV